MMAKKHEVPFTGVGQREDISFISGVRVTKKAVRKLGNAGETSGMNIAELRLDKGAHTQFNWNTVEKSSPLYQIFDLDVSSFPATEQEFIETLSEYLAKGRLPFQFENIEDLEKTLREKFKLK